jgi:hypothetical protein
VLDSEALTEVMKTVQSSGALENGELSFSAPKNPLPLLNGDSAGHPVFEDGPSARTVSPR